MGGFCRCGGIGPDYPRCDANATCDLSTPTPTCEGVERCREKDCPRDVPGSSCDPEDGLCKCGGLDGLECGAPGQAGRACAVDGGENLCTTVCDPLASGCAQETPCTYDPRRRLALCLPQGDTLGRTCKASQDCLPGWFCPLADDPRVCRELCDLDAAADACPPTRACAPLPGSPYPRLGQCLPL